MKKFGAYLGTLGVTILLGATASFAQTPAPAAPAVAPAAAAPAAAKAAAPAGAPMAADAKAPAAAKAAAKPTKAMAPRTEKSKECSRKADEQKLHGKERQKFRADCKKAA